MVNLAVIDTLASNNHQAISKLYPEIFIYCDRGIALQWCKGCVTVFQITNNSPVCSVVYRVNDKEKLNVCMTGPISGEPNNTPVCRKLLFSTISYGEPVHLPPQGQWLGPVNCKLIYIYNINAVFLFCNSNILSHIKHTLHNFQHEYCCLRIRSLILVLSELTWKACGTS